MIKVKTKRKGHYLIVSHKLKRSEQIAYLEQDLIKEGAISELRPVQVHIGYFGTRIDITLDGCITVQNYLQSGISWKAFCKCMLNIIHTIQHCEAQGISISNLELRPSYIFFDRNQNHAVMLYWPILSMKEYPDVRGLFLTLIGMYRYEKKNERIYFEIVNLISKREKVDLSEWEKRFQSYKEKDAGKTGIIGLYHAGKKQKIEITKIPFIVGRQPGICDYLVKDSLVSRQHFEIVIHENLTYVRDLNSANGTYVDGRPIGGREVLLTDGSMIGAGSQKFQVYLE